MPEKINPVRDEALRLYDSFGWFVLPTDPGGKKPYYGFTYKDRYGDKLPDRTTVATWPEWERQGAGLGTRTGAVSGIVVLDVDTQEAHEFVKKNGFLPGPMVQTPREGAGYHLYFKHPGFYVKSNTYVGDVEGLDIRGDWGITVLPPSVHHKSGREYSWIIPPWDAALPDCPKWLIDLLKKDKLKEPFDVAWAMSGVAEGQRDSTLNSLAGKMRRENFPEDFAILAIEQCAQNCNPPVSKAEARAKVKWAYTHYAPGEDIRPILVPGDGSTPEEDVDTFTLETLMKEEYPPVKWVVPNLIPEGSMMFAGKPKMGKSWMALGFCIAVATGGKALGEYDCEEGDVLYLALEDNQRRLQSRAKELLKSESRGPGSLSRLSMRVRSKRLDAGLLGEVADWLDKHPEARLVVIDTLGSVRGATDRRTLYEQDYEVGAAITRTANDYGIAILVIHHMRKGDAEDFLETFSGSTGLTGGLDGGMGLIRTRSAADGILKAAHRDLENDPEIALTKVEAYEGWWRYAGDAEEYRLGKERKEILDVLVNAAEAMKPSDIADQVGKTAKNVSELLRRMMEDGHVDTQGYGKYVAAGEHPPVFTVGSVGSVGSSPLSSGSTSNTSNTSNGPEEEGAEF